MMTDGVFVVEDADLGVSVVDVKVDLAITDGVFVNADFGASVVDFNVDLAITDAVSAVDDSMPFVPLTIDDYEALG